jgi:GNAT superfamily N-acetyltransferase
VTRDLLFADPALAARVETAEAGLATAIGRHAGAEVTPVAGGRAVLVRPGSPVNKVIGAGFGAGLDDAVLDAVEARWRGRGEPVRFEIATLADPSLGAALTGRGYRLERFENVLGCAPIAGAPPAGVVVVPARDGDPAWRQIAIEGFAHPDGSVAAPEPLARQELVDVMDDVATVPGIRRFWAQIDGVAVGIASLWIDGGVAILCGATTLPAWRRRGVQGALLAARIAAAERAGCDLTVVTTDPGSRSQRNAHRAGFSLLYARAVVVRGWAAPAIPTQT